MKKIVRIALMAMSAILLTSVLVSATVAATSKSTVEFSSTAFPQLNCKIGMRQASDMFALLPANIQSELYSEYKIVSARCKVKPDFKYEGVRVQTFSAENGITISLSCNGYSLTARDTDWGTLDGIFSQLNH